MKSTKCADKAFLALRKELFGSLLKKAKKVDTWCDQKLIEAKTKNITS